MKRKWAQKSITFLKTFLKVYLFWERAREHVSGGREGQRGKVSSRLPGPEITT